MSVGIYIYVVGVDVHSWVCMFPSVYVRVQGPEGGLRFLLSEFVYLIVCVFEYVFIRIREFVQVHAYHTNYTATCLPSWKLSKLDEPDMQVTAGEAGTSS